MLGLSLAFVCALAWAGLDVFRKQLGGEIKPLLLLFLLNVGLLPVFAIWWLLTGGVITDLPAYAPPAGAALVLQVIANLLFLAAIRISPLSLTIPFLALTPVFATGLGALILDEQPEPVQLLGIALVVGGALALSSAADDERARPKLLRTFVREPGAWMMIGVAACWGLTTVLDKRALEFAAVPIHALIQLSGVILAGLVYLLIARPRRQLARARAQLGRLVLATLTGSAALGLQLIAVQHIHVGQLETIKRAVGLLGAIVFGRLVFGEPITKTKTVAIVVMVAGVVLLMLGKAP
jgi:drug/metabolite transporter (DMT)-like permease